MKKLIIAALAAALTIPVLAATPFRDTITMAAGSGSTTLDRNYVATKVTHLVHGGAAGQTSTVYVVSGTLTNSYGAKVIAANDRVQPLTNAVYLFKNDKILVTSTDTNGHSVSVIGELSPD